MLCPLPARHSQAGALAQVAAFAIGAYLKWWLWMPFATSCDGVLGSGFCFFKVKFFCRFMIHIVGLARPAAASVPDGCSKTNCANRFFFDCLLQLREKFAKEKRIQADHHFIYST